jgi:hypothetical protein
VIKTRGQQGHDLLLEAQKGQRIIWMKQQADRLDPMQPSPLSILDRKGDLRNSSSGGHFALRFAMD